MLNLDNILEKIKSDADNEAKSILDEAKEKYDEILKKAKAEAEKEFDASMARAKRDAEEHYRRLISMAQLDMRKEILTAKQELIDRAFKEAGDVLINMNKEDYVELLFKLLLKSELDGNVKIIFSKKDRENMPDFIERANEYLKLNNKQLTLNLSDESFEGDGGFILSSKGIEENYRIKTLIEEKREEIEPDVISILFE
ncbi:MAG: V-type ATP synthase subunit E [Thermoanaerobacteraceae bacterium]|nr:V-type ATP synthase subunit E [Thermoanaerobacteraceae bacterium]